MSVRISNRVAKWPVLVVGHFAVYITKRLTADIMNIRYYNGTAPGSASMTGNSKSYRVLLLPWMGSQGEFTAATRKVYNLARGQPVPLGSEWKVYNLGR